MSSKSAKLLFAVAAIFLAHSGSAQDLNPREAQNEIPQPVNLTGVATFIFEPAKERYEDWQAHKPAWTPDFALLVDEAGTPTYCQPIAEKIDKELAARLCTDLVANARVDILKGFSFGGRMGVVAVNMEPVTVLPGFGDSDSPFSFALSELGPSEFTDYAPLSTVELEGAEGEKNVVSVGKPPSPVYPNQAQVKRHSGTSELLLTIGGDGEVLTCRPFASSGYALLDNEACKYALGNLKFALVEGVKADEAPFYYTLKMTFLIKD